MNRLERLLDLVHVLQKARSPVTFEALRHTFADYAGGKSESARRKFERDKAALAELGLVLHYAEPDGEDEGGYILDADASFLPPIELAPDERALLINAARAAISRGGSASGLPHRGALGLALAKLGADAATRDATDEDEPISERYPVIVPSLADDDADPAHLELLGDALARRKEIRIRYRRPGRDEAWRTLRPYALFAKSGIWHVAGHDDRRDATRLFRVSRIRELEINPRRPTQPDYDIPESFSATHAMQIDPLRYEVHEPIVCTIRVDPELAFLMRGRWGEPDAQGVFQVETTNLEPLMRQVLDLGLRAEVMSPPEVREKFRDALRAVLSAHEARA